MAADDRQEAGRDQERREGRGEEVTAGPREEYVLRPAGGPFRIDYEAELNPQQLAVVTAGAGPLLVIAGAGSGKTRALTYRVARLVESGVPPGAILLLTFTNKAAREMVRRAELLLGSAVSVAGGTFHHAGHLALRRHGEAVGLSRNFTIADRGDASDLIEDVAAELYGKRDLRLPKGEVLLDVVSMAANTGKTLEAVLEQKYAVHLELLPEIAAIADAYARRKEKLGIADFDDLLTLWLRAMEESAEVRDAFQSRYAYVLVDEYQDTNLLQSRLVDLLAGKHRNLMVVGDDAQSIYSFRGANFANIIGFRERWPEASVCRLEINYRSSPQILALANASIAHNRLQYEKRLTTENPPGPPPQLVPLDRPEEQAQFVAQRLQELEDEGVPLDEIAVLYRAHFHAMELQMELTRRGIPFEVRSGLRFFELAHVKDATAYLRIAANPRDEMAWKRVLRLYPKVGKVTADKAWRAVDAARDPLPALLKGDLAVPRPAAAAMAAVAETLRAVASQPNRPGLQLDAVLAGGYQQHLFDTYENAAARIQDLKTLASFATKFDSTDAFLAELALQSNAAEVSDPDAAPPGQKVVLSTVHQAKGLEWTAVFVVWLVDGRFPDARSLAEGNEEEERRLFYVAATRARRHLFLCYPVTAREGAFPGVFQRCSRFVQELPEELYTQVQVRRQEWGGGGKGRAGAAEDDADRWVDDGKSPWDE